VQSVTETMNVIRMIKLFGWEGRTNERVAGKRDDELRYQRDRQLLVLLSGTITFVTPLLDRGTVAKSSYSYSIPVVAMAVCFACYVSKLCHTGIGHAIYFSYPVDNHHETRSDRYCDPFVFYPCMHAHPR
jgi:hypothetical protein